MTEQIIFYTLALAITVFSILAVTSKLILRSATYLLFVLLGTAGLFLLLDYTFLFTVQVAVYCGGIMVLFIMAIFLTHKPGKRIHRKHGWRVGTSLALSLGGLLLCAHIIFHNAVGVYRFIEGEGPNIQEIGSAMLGTEKYQYLLPFETMSVLLLACIVGAILIARKTKKTYSDTNETD